MKPLITLAIPVYNIEKYVERALLSALNQTYDNLEILIIDDKGTDNSINIVTKIVKTHPRGKIVKIIDHKVNKGTGATKNSAIANASGEYLYFMDSDDYISEDCIMTLFNEHSGNSYDIVAGNFVHKNVDGIHEYPNNSIDKIFNGSNCYYDYFKSKGFYIQTWNKLFRTELLRNGNVHCIPSNTNEDIYFSFQLFPLVKSIATLTKITYFYSIGDENATTTGIRRNLIEKKRVDQYIGILSQMYSDIINSNVDCKGQKVLFLMIETGLKKIL